MTPIIPTLVYYLCPPGKWTKPVNMTGIILDHVVLFAVGPDLLPVPRDSLHCHRAPSSFKASSGIALPSHALNLSDFFYFLKKYILLIMLL